MTFILEIKSGFYFRAHREGFCHSFYVSHWIRKIFTLYKMNYTYYSRVTCWRKKNTYHYSLRNIKNILFFETSLYFSLCWPYLILSLQLSSKTSLNAFQNIMFSLVKDWWNFVIFVCIFSCFFFLRKKKVFIFLFLPSIFKNQVPWNKSCNEQMNLHKFLHISLLIRIWNKLYAAIILLLFFILHRIDL